VVNFTVGQVKFKKNLSVHAMQGSYAVLDALKCQIRFQDLEKSIEFGQNVHTVLKKY